MLSLNPQSAIRNRFVSGELIILTVVSILVIVGLLLYAHRRSSTLSGFLVSERSLGGVVSAFTYSTAAVSAGLFIGGAGFAYTYGWAGATYQLGALTGIFLTWLLVAPRVRKIASAVGALSTPKFLAERFECPSFRTITSALTVVFVLPMIVIQFRGAGLLFENYLGLDYAWSVIVFGLLVGLFTALGGNFAVSYLSTILGTLMVIGSMACIGSGLSQVGGLQTLNARLAASDASLVGFVGRVPWPVWWNLLVIFGLAQFSNPHLIPRFFSLRDNKAVRLALPLSMFINCLWVCAAVLIGLVARVQYPGLTSGDQAMPVFMRSLSPAMSVLILIALMSAIFTTIDTLLLAVGSNISHDLIKGLLWPRLSERGELLLARFSMLVICAICLSLSLLELPLITLINSFAMGAFILILGLPLVMGIFFRRATKEAALTAAIGGPMIYLVWKYAFEPLTGIGEMIASLAIIIPTVMVVSLLTRPTELDVRHQTSDIRPKHRMLV
jgi:SSS family transporter